MSRLANLTIQSKSPEDSSAVAIKLSRILRPGDVVLLSGPIGAGKSLFARSLIRALGVVEDIPSPTFTLVQTYDTQNGEIWHSDLYRLGHVDEVAELGLLDAFETAITLIEWPELITQEAPSSALHVEFLIGTLVDDRNLHFSTDSSRWAAFLESLQSEVPA